MIWLACAPAEEEPPTDAFVRYEGLSTPPDVGTERLCPAEEAVADPVHLACATEGARFAEDPPPSGTFVAWTWNLARGGAADEVIDWLASASEPLPDVLLANELDRGCSRTGTRNLPWEIAQALGWDYVFAVEFVELPRADGSIAAPCEHGNAVFSRFPIGNVRQVRHAEQWSWFVPEEDRAEAAEPRLGGRIALVADLWTGDGIVRVASIHFESQLEALTTIQVAQAGETAAELADAERAVAGGDTNAGLYLVDLQQGTSLDGTTGAFFAAGYTDAHADLPVEERPTREGLVLDLLLGRGVAFDAPEVCAPERCGSFSDHLPVWAEVTP